jgi:hypothetical protein
MFYVSRWYDPSLGRFVQADTLIPESTQGTQAWDRYAYVNNNPVRYTDPSGHFGKDNTICLDDGWCGSSSRGGDPVPLSDMSRRLIEFANSVNKSPEDVIANGLAGELAGTANDPVYRAAFKEQVYNCFIWFAKHNCGGRLTHNCMLNYFTSNYQSVYNQFWDMKTNSKAGYWGKPGKYDLYYGRDWIGGVKVDAGKDIMDNFWSSMTPERRAFDPDNNLTDRDKPFDTGIVLATDVNKLLQPMNMYVVDFIKSSCSGDRSKPAYSVILNWYGSYVLSRNRVGVC